jgi:hypothetical protein
MYLKVKAHQFMCTKLTLNLKLMCSTLNHLFGVVPNVFLSQALKDCEK